MKNVRTAAIALGLTLGLGVCSAPAASAEESVGSFTLDVKSMITYQVQEWTLTCEPTGGTHPDAEAACADLIAANGDISAIPPLPGACHWDSPVAIDVIGTWAGHGSYYAGSFDNLCTANLATGGHVLSL